MKIYKMQQSILQNGIVPCMSLYNLVLHIKNTKNFYVPINIYLRHHGISLLLFFKYISLLFKRGR